MGPVLTKKVDRLIIRSMELDNFTDVLKIGRKISGRKRSIIFDDLIVEEFSEELNLSIIAQIDEQIVGFMIARHAYIGEPIEEVGLIQVIGVTPDYWGQGIGTMLVEALEAKCKSNGIKLIRAMVKYKGSQLRKFFNILGYESGQLIDYNKVV